MLRVLVQGLDAAERDEVGEVGHGEKRGEEKQAKHTPRKGYRKSFKEGKWIIFSRPLLSLSLLSSKLLHTQAKGRGLLLPLALLPSPRLHARPKDEESIINRGRGQEVISRRRCSRIQFFLQSSTSFYLFSLALPSSPPFLRRLVGPSSAPSCAFVRRPQKADLPHAVLPPPATSFATTYVGAVEARDAAAVIKWKADYTYDTLRQGTNKLVCYDRSGQPLQQPFAVECTMVGNLKRVAQSMKFEAVGDRTKANVLLDAAEKDGTRCPVPRPPALACQRTAAMAACGS